MKNIYLLFVLFLSFTAVCDSSAGRPEEPLFLINDGAGTEFVPVASFKGKDNKCASGMLWKGWEDDSAWCDLDAAYSRQEEEGVPFQRVVISDVNAGQCQLTRGMGGIKGRQWMLLKFRARASHVLPVQFGVRMNNPPYEFHWDSDIMTGNDWTDYTYLVELNAEDADSGFYFNIPGESTFELMSLSLEKISRKKAKALKKSGKSAPAPEKPRSWPERMRGVTVSLHMKEKDIEDLSKWNINLARIHMSYGSIVESDPPYKFKEDDFKQLDRMLDWCEKRGIRCVIDVHEIPGKRTICSAELIDRRIWRDFKYHDLLVRIWKKLAERYSDRGAVVAGYDLLNEPAPGNYIPGSPADWFALVQRLIDAIREIDPDTPIIVEPRHGGRLPEYISMPEFDDPHIIYSVHNYKPLDITHQGIEPVVGMGDVSGMYYPGKGMHGKMWDKKQLMRIYSQVIDFQERTGAEIYAGEFSCVRWAPGDTAVNYLRDSMDIFEEHGWHWTYHAFREYDGWSLEHSDDRGSMEPDPGNKRLKLMLKYFNKNK